MTKPSYCTNSHVETCEDCSLTNYGKDCQNNPIGKEKVIGMQVRLPESLHKELKKRLIDDGGSIQELFIQAVKEYLSE